MKKDVEIIEPISPPERPPEVKIDEDITTYLDTEQLQALEDLYELWSWHPGMG
tara:strand:+ start:437 stop:595 length:159 start_codon:yes stop_codon:yes gene_type:complete